jgi:hypothetical protein
MKKFTQNDLFYNTILANPKYKITMQSGSMRINDQIEQNNEHSSSINGIDYGGQYRYGTKFSGSYSYTSSIGTSFVYATSSGFGEGFQSYYTRYSDVQKISALKNILPSYRIENQYADIKYYLKDDGIPYLNLGWKPGDVFLAQTSPKYFIVPTCSISLIEIPRDFFGNYIKPGSVTLNLYVSGALTASASDTDFTGKLFQTYGVGSGSVIGSVLYDHGLILLTGSENITGDQAPYIQPLAEYTASKQAIDDNLKWIYFGSFMATSGAAPETRSELIFQGTNFVPTITMMCSAERSEFNWSNNKTFIEAGQGDKIFQGQAITTTTTASTPYAAPQGSVLVPSVGVIKENPEILIKNTISSSFAHYSSSYEPQVFISQIGIYDDEKNLIGIAKLANPVRKTKDLDFTFKLRIDA